MCLLFRSNLPIPGSGHSCPRGLGSCRRRVCKAHAFRADEEDTNIADLAGTPMTNPKTKKKKSKKHATPATAPSGTRSPRLAAKQLARAEGSK